MRDTVILVPGHRLGKANAMLQLPCCLNYFELHENVQAGIVVGMGHILETQMKAEKVITL